MAYDLQIASDFQAKLGESPGWYEGQLYWVDIDRSMALRMDPTTGKNHIISLPDAVGCIVPRTSGGAVLAMREGFYGFDFESEAITPLATGLHDLPNCRFNDGKCDSLGRLYAGTTNPKREASFFRMDTDLKVKELFGGVGISNGIAINENKGILYYADTPTLKIDAFDWDMATGDIKNRRTVISIDRGMPDGMTIDDQGKLWVAHWEGNCITRYDPDSGEILERIDIPASRVSSCAFGGEKLNRLYITTAAKVSEPMSGLLYSVELAVTGPAAQPFRG